MLKSEAASERAAFSAEHDAARTEQDRLVAELETARTHANGLAAHTAELEAALGAHRALLHVVAVGDQPPHLAAPNPVAAWYMALAPDSEGS